MRDADVRAALLRELESEYRDDPGTRIVQEMGVWAGTVRIDVAVINGELNGYELKSERDTLERLPYQAEIYSRVFDRVVLVTGRRHIQKACAVIPKWWGILGAIQGKDGIELTLEREGDANPEIDPHIVAQLLWKDEAIAVLEKHGLARGYRTKRARLIYERLAEELPLAILGEDVRAALKCRGQWLRQMVTYQLDVPVDPKLNPML
jgi:hypothetical protein